MNRKKILYFQHVPWEWIKQRPQFLAEELSKYYDVTVVNTIMPGQKRGMSDKNVDFFNIYRLPMEKYAPIAFVNSILKKMQLLFLTGHFDYVWLALPSFINHANKFLKGAKLIYDCMDDHLEFNVHPKYIDEMYKNERIVCEKADFVFTSSAYLRDKLIERYGERPISVIYNAVSDSIINEGKNFILNNEIKSLFDKNYYNISYIGTIAEWFDFDLIKETLNRKSNIRFHLFGPLLVDIPTIPGLIHHGPIPHSDVLSAMECSDALVMPFMVTELIKSVNPVKLYEYILSGKPCFAPKYGESMQFSNFIQLYNDKEDFLNLLNVVMNNDVVKPKQERMEFIRNNTWQSRVEMIYSILD